MNEEEEENVDDPDFDDVSEEEANGMIFVPGSEILILLADGKKTAGAYVGLTEFGVIFRATYRMKMIQETVDTETANLIRESMFRKTVAELKELAEEEGISLKGAKKKVEMVAEITDCMIAEVNALMEPHEELVALKRTVMTFLPWQEVARIERADEYLEEKDLERFSVSLDQFTGIDENDPAIGSDESKVSDE